MSNIAKISALNPNKWSEFDKNTSAVEVTISENFSFYFVSSF